MGADEPNPKTVSELLTVLRGLVADERARGQGLDAKTSTMTGFTGATLALVASLSGEVQSRDLGDLASPIAKVVFAATICALAGAAILGLAGVLRPQERLDIEADEIRGFGEFPLIAETPMEVQGRMINALIAELLHERARNDRKARLTQQTGAALVFGYIGVATVALVVAIAPQSVETSTATGQTPPHACCRSAGSADG